MSNVKIGKGYAWAVKKSGKRKPIDTLQEALAEEAKCYACGCDSISGFFTMQDLIDDTLQLVFISNQALYTILDTSANRILFANCCKERAAGTLNGTACQALVTAATAINA